MGLMNWVSAANFLERFKNFKLPKEAVLEEALKVIESVCGVRVGKEEASISAGILRLKTKSAAEKSQIFLNKEQILERFKEKNIPFRDIRF